MTLSRILPLTLCAPLLGSCWLIFPSPPPPPSSLYLSFTVPEIPAAARGNAYLGLFWYDADANATAVVTSRLADSGPVPLTSPPLPPSYGNGRELFVSGYALQVLQNNPKFLLSLEGGEARNLSATNLSGADGVRTGTLYPFIWNDVNANGQYDPLSEKVVFDTNDVISYANKDFNYSFEGNKAGTVFRQSGNRRQGWTHVRHFVLSGASGNELTWNSLAPDSPALYTFKMKEPTNFASSMEVRP